MRRTLIPALSLLSLLVAAPTLHAAKPTVPAVEAATATHLEIEVAELGKDGARRATTLTLTLPDRRDRGGDSAELKTRVQGPDEVHYYRATLELEDTPAGTRYNMELWRAGNSEFNHSDLRLKVGRVLKRGAPQQIARVTRPDESTLLVTATLR